MCKTLKYYQKHTRSGNFPDALILFRYILGKERLGIGMKLLMRWWGGTCNILTQNVIYNILVDYFICITLLSTETVNV
jgi:hypothetical protein